MSDLTDSSTLSCYSLLPDDSLYHDLSLLSAPLAFLRQERIYRERPATAFPVN
jgi:hypothetical protein